MKLNELYTKSINESIKELELSDMKIHTDDDGNVKSVELKYTEMLEQKKTENRPW